MKYAKVENGRVTAYPYVTLHADNPNTSFPNPLTEDVLSQFNVYIVVETEKPTPLWWQTVEEVTPVPQNGTWKQAWSVVPKSTAERDELIAREWVTLRATRNALLAECDWTQLADSPVDKTIWATYRQSLRDLPSNTSNPFEVQWPLRPE